MIFVNCVINILYYISKTMSQPSEDITKVQSFIDSIAKFTFQEKYYKWESYIIKWKDQEPNYYRTILEKFVQFFPFNHTYWSEICDLYLLIPKTGKESALRKYQAALTRNPRSIVLWQKYLTWLKKQICKSDPGYLKKQYDRATKIIGNHYKAGFIFQNLFLLQQSAIKKFEYMKKALVSPLEDIDKLYDMVQTYISKSEQLTMEVLMEIARSENLLFTESNPEGFQIEIRQLLRYQMRKLYEPSKRHVQKRYLYQSKLTSLDEYKPYSGNIEIWRSYINFMKNSGNVDFLNPLYEIALITNCDNESLWQDYLLHLQTQNDYKRALYLLRSHTIFFRNFSKELVYYWLELQQRENFHRSRDLYLEIQKTDPHLDIFLRHIQMQIRQHEYINARVLYQTILTTFTTNTKIVSFVVLEYAQLATKYFRDIDVKKTLRSYFESYPFHEQLFFGLLQFYIKHIQIKQSSKEGKQICEQFISIIIDGLRRAMANNPEKYKKINKVAKKYLRDYILSIFLIKTAQKRIKDMQMQVKKQKDVANKRSVQKQSKIGEEEQFDHIKKRSVHP